MALLEAQGLTRRVPGATLVDNVSFTLEPSELVAVVGASGSGKTSLLRLLCRLDEPDAGTVLLEGVPYGQIAPRELRRRVALVAQHPVLLPGTVEDNVALGPRVRGAAVDQAEIDRLLEALDLDRLRDQDADTVSGGQRQRVAVARALANGPDVLLLDEPTSDLDAAARDRVEALVGQAVRDQAVACLVVTHDREQARRMADRVLVMERGRLEAP